LIQRFAFLIVFFSFPVFSQTNHLTNGSFENWDNLDNIPVGWQLQTTTNREQSTDATEGTYSLKLSNDEKKVIDLSVTLSDWFLLQAETTYTISYSFKVIKGKVEYMSSTAYPQNGIDYGSRIISEIENNKWIIVTHQFTAKASTDHFMDIFIQKESVDADVEILIDNVKLESGIAVYPDREALVALYQSTNGPNWTYSWDYHRDISLFPFSSFNNQGRVQSILLYENNMSGTIPIEIGNLTHATRLGIRNNPNLRGQIPSEIGNLSQLTELNFEGCDLNGAIPSSIGLLANLKNIRLGENNFSSIPSEIENLGSLEELDLSKNQITSLPSSISNLTQLRFLDLSYCNFDFQPFPSEILQLQNLEYLNLENSLFYGEIPSEIWSKPYLRHLDLSNNELFGSIPSSFGNSLQVVDLSYCPIGAELPINIEEAFSLQKLDLSNCGLYGNIPESFGSFAYLNEVQLSGNNLMGNIPTFLNSNLILDISDNEFVFEDLTNSVIGNFNYSNQKNIGWSETITRTEGESFSISVTRTTDANNSYLWMKNGNVLTPNQTQANLTINNITQNDQGSYQCFITNSSIPDLTLIKAPINLQVEIGDNDNDGVSNNNDNCANTPTGETVDANGCSQGQLDDDNDGVTNNNDNCANTPTGETVDTNGCSDSQLDDDNDGVTNNNDNCPNTPTGETADANGCSESQLDDDNDGVTNDNDNCPNTTSGITADSNGCPVVITSDTDNDGVTNNNDNCPNTPTGESVNSNGCSESQLDNDNDGVTNDNDNCPNTPSGTTVDANGCSQSQLDDDNDGITNNNDNCANTPTEETADANGCSDSQLDDDNDGVTNNNDNCPNTLIGESADANGCSQNQLDDDNDGVFNYNDNCSNTPTGTTVDANGCPVVITSDTDNDGITDANDICPNTPTGGPVNSNGCSESQLDDDNDGVTNDNDNCPNTTSGTTVDSNGCPVVITSDTDNDGITDENDICPNTPTAESVNSNGCSESQLDDDNDGVTNDNDNCPNTTSGTTVDSNGCPILITSDTDNDGVTNNNDNCPNTATGVMVDTSGCPVTGNNDGDNDGVTDADDTCPNTPTGETVNTNGCSDSQLDDDNDGVTNNNDNCPNTPIGETVDIEGCVVNQSSEPNIPNNGIQVKVTSTSCLDSENGEISVSFTEDYAYSVQITAALLDNTFDNINSSTGLVRSDLPADKYMVCITIPDYPNFEQCFTIKIETPENFSSGKIVVDKDLKTGKVSVSGSKNYVLFINDQERNYSFETIGNQELSFELEEGLNHVLVKTDKDCQGKYEENILFNVIRAYPNPVSDKANVFGIQNTNDARILISDMNGAIVKNMRQDITDSAISISVEDLPVGVYLLRIISEEQDVQTKIIKK
jgi:ribosomal protein S27AE